ncbi:hypothetical protein HK096_011070 [Nowakowskiella sp. JEL0078]|nr:hypothetical protein HK096_011070 [Nowakowskiella sp. JEL0078]
MGNTLEQHMEISHQLSIPKAFITVKDSHIYLIERVSLIPKDAKYQTLWSMPIICHYTISSLIGDAILYTSCSVPLSQEIQMPRWSAMFDEYEDAVLVDNSNFSITAIVSTALAIAGAGTSVAK